MASKATPDKPLFVEANVDRWIARIADIARDKDVVPTKVYEKIGFAGATYSDAINKRNPPGLKLLLLLAEHFDYPVADQLADLTGREREWIAPPSQVEAAFASKLELFSRIESALDVAGQRSPSVPDLVRRVLETSEQEPPVPSEGLSSAGRWRARLFDVPMGWRFPHVGYHGVEFMRWYGPNRGSRDDIYSSRDWWQRRGQSSDRVERMTEKVWFEKTSPENFVHGQDVWDTFRFERTEVLHRMHPLFARARLTPYGAFGQQHTALLRHSENPGPRHIFTQMTPNTIPDLADRVGSDLDIHTVLVVGHQSVRPIAIGGRLAEAMGWQLKEFRLLQAHLTGRRPLMMQHVNTTLAAQRSEVDLVWERLTSLSGARNGPVVIPVNSQYMLHGKGYDATLSPAARRAMEDPRVLVVLLTTPFDVDATDGHSEEGWMSSTQRHEKRVAGQSHAGVLGTIHSEGVAEYIVGLIGRDAGPSTRLVQAIVRPTYLHSGPAYTPDGSPDTFPSFLWHPTVGDIDVRAAFEIGHFLATGSALTRTGARSKVSFAPGSVVHRHLPQLRAMTGGSYWNPGNEQHTRHTETHFLRPEVIAPPPAPGAPAPVSPYYGSKPTRAVEFVS